MYDYLFDNKLVTLILIYSGITVLLSITTIQVRTQEGYPRVLLYTIFIIYKKENHVIDMMMITAVKKMIVIAQEGKIRYTSMFNTKRSLVFN